MSWFTNPLGLIAFAAIPAVIALHLFRRRHQNLPVSSLFLWLSPEARESSGRRRQPLRRTPSFWLELAAALMAALFLSGFNPLANSDAVHLIVVLDDSASMSSGLPLPNASAGSGAANESATSSTGNSIHDRLSQRLEQEFDRLGRRTRVSLIRSGVRPTLLCGPGALIPEAREALRNWRPTAPGHDPRPAISLARELALGHEIWFFTDQEPDPGYPLGDEVRVIGFGADNANAALIDVRRQSSDGGFGEEENGAGGTDLVQCAVRLYGNVAMSNQLDVIINGEVMVTRKFDLQPGSDLNFRFPIPATTPAVELRLQPDAVAVDNRATLYPNPDRTVAIGYQLDDGVAEQLRLPDFAEALPQVRLTPSLDQAHLVFAHDAAPQPAWSFVLPHDPTSDSGTGATGSSADAEAFLQGFLPEKRHPLLRGMTFEGLLWTRARNFAPAGLPLLSVGRHPLIAESVLGRASVFMVNLLPQRSTLVQSPDWPILVSNLVELRRTALEGPREVNLVAGQAFEYLRQGRAQFTLNGGGVADKTFASDGNLRIEDLPPAPAYLLSFEQTPLVRFAVNFMDPAESDLSQATSFENPPLVSSTDLAQQNYAESPMGRILLLLLTVLLLADWLYLGRRRPR